MASNKRAKKLKASARAKAEAIEVKKQKAILAAKLQAKEEARRKRKAKLTKVISILKKKIPTLKKPTLQEPTLQEPTLQEPTLQEPTLQEPTLQEPNLQELILQEPTLQEPTLQEPTLQEPTLQEPTLQEPTLQEPTLQDSEPKEIKPVVDSIANNLVTIKIEAPLIRGQESSIAAAVTKMERALSNTANFGDVFSSLPHTVDMKNEKLTKLITVKPEAHSLALRTLSGFQNYFDSKGLPDITSYPTPVRTTRTSIDTSSERAMAMLQQKADMYGGNVDVVDSVPYVTFPNQKGMRSRIVSEPTKISNTYIEKQQELEEALQAKNILAEKKAKEKAAKDKEKAEEKALRELRKHSKAKRRYIDDNTPKQDKEPEASKEAASASSNTAMLGELRTLTTFAKIYFIITKLIALVQQIYDLMLTTATQSYADSIQGDSLGMSAMDVRTLRNIGNKTMLDDAIINAVAETQDSFGDIFSIAENSDKLKSLGIVMGSGINTIVQNGLGSTDPVKLMSIIIDAFTEKAAKGVTVEGTQVGVADATANLGNYLKRTMGENYSSTFYRLMEDYRNESMPWSERNKALNFEQWRESNTPIITPYNGVIEDANQDVKHLSSISGDILSILEYLKTLLASKLDVFINMLNGLRYALLILAKDDIGLENLRNDQRVKAAEAINQLSDSEASYESVLSSGYDRYVDKNTGKPVYTSVDEYKSALRNGSIPSGLNEEQTRKFLQDQNIAFRIDEIQKQKTANESELEKKKGKNIYPVLYNEEAITNAAVAHQRYVLTLEDTNPDKTYYTGGGAVIPKALFPMVKQWDTFNNVVMSTLREQSNYTSEAAIAQDLANQAAADATLSQYSAETQSEYNGSYSRVRREVNDNNVNIRLYDASGTEVYNRQFSNTTGLPKGITEDVVLSQRSGGKQ